MRALIIFLVTLHFPLLHAEPLVCEESKNTPSIRYLGVAAFDIQYQNQRILTDPFYSPHSYWDLLYPYESDQAQIKKVLGQTNSDVNTVFIGHGHYDHAADLPALNDYFSKDISIYTSKSSQLLLETLMDSKTLKGMTESDYGKWQFAANGWIRFQAYASEHAPQAFGINLFPKVHKKKVSSPPKYIWDWTQGTNINWLIDFLETPNSQSVIQRIFIQTSASEFPAGLPEINDSIAIDKAFLAAASFDNVDNYPTGIITTLNPESIYFIHWENFFKPWFDAPDSLSQINFELLFDAKTLANRGEDAFLAQPNHCY